MQPFDELRIHRTVLQQMAEIRKANPGLAACLDAAFLKIKTGAVALEPHFLPGVLPDSVVRCGYRIFVTDLGRTGVVTGLQESSQDLLV